MDWNKIQTTTDEVVKLTDEKNELLNELEYYEEHDGLAKERELEILTRVDEIYKQLEKLEG